MFKRNKIRKRKRINPEARIKTRISVLIGFFLAVMAGVIAFFISRNILNSILSFIVIFFIFIIYIVARIKLIQSAKVKKMETIFPDFLQLVSSNLRAGMTTDRALLLSARKEFSPLDIEIIRLGKDLVTGKKIESALTELGERINSEKIKKTINLIVSSISSGGNLAILLEQTASNMRQKGFVEKKAASNVLMYVIFIFFATAIGAPALFALSSVLVEILSSVLATIPEVQTSTSLPFTLTKITVSVKFITYFSTTFIIVTDILGSLVLGLVSKGEEKEGIKFMVPLLIMSLLVFFLARIILLGFFSDFFV